jgi:hypothetical protein
MVHINQKLKKIKKLVLNAQIFLVVDETSNKGKYYTNILIGLLNQPHKTYAICLDFAENAPNSAHIFDLIENCIVEFSITK